jgi:hypothetical protein
MVNEEAGCFDVFDGVEGSITIIIGDVNIPT